MSKKFIALLTVFLIVFSIFVYVKFFYSTATSIQSSSAKQPVSAPFYQTSLSLLPGSLEAIPNQNASINVALNSDLPGDKPKLVQIELAYNPAVLYNVQVIPGDYFLDPEIVLENIDMYTGRISYAITCHPALDAGSNCVNQNSNIVATINFTSVNYGLQRETEITFLPKTLIRQDDEVVKLKTSGTKIILPAQTPRFFPGASPSAPISTPQ